MKRYLFVICLVLLHLCSCYRGELGLMDQEQMQPEVHEFQNRLSEALITDKLTTIMIDDISVTNPEQIDRWLKTLKKMDVESIPYDECETIGDIGFEVSLVYPDDVVKLGVFFSTCIEVCYFTPPENALRITNYNEIKDELAALKDACGYVRPAP